MILIICNARTHCDLSWSICVCVAAVYLVCKLGFGQVFVECGKLWILAQQLCDVKGMNSRRACKQKSQAQKRRAFETHLWSLFFGFFFLASSPLGFSFLLSFFVCPKPSLKKSGELRGLYVFRASGIHNGLDLCSKVNLVNG